MVRMFHILKITILITSFLSSVHMIRRNVNLVDLKVDKDINIKQNAETLDIPIPLQLEKILNDISNLDNSYKELVSSLSTSNSTDPPYVPPKPSPKPSPKPKPRPKPDLHSETPTCEPSIVPSTLLYGSETSQPTPLPTEIVNNIDTDNIITIVPTTLTTSFNSVSTTFAPTTELVNITTSIPSLFPTTFNSSNTDSTTSSNNSSLLQSSWVIYTSVLVAFIIFTLLYLVAFRRVYFRDKLKNAFNLNGLKEISKLMESDIDIKKDYHSNQSENDILNTEYNENSYQNNSYPKSTLKGLYDIYDSKSMEDEENPLMTNKNYNLI